MRSRHFYTCERDLCPCLALLRGEVRESLGIGGLADNNRNSNFLKFLTNF